MADFYCVVIVVCLIIGFILGRWRTKEYCGDIIVSADDESCTFALDIPTDDISLYRHYDITKTKIVVFENRNL